MTVIVELLLQLGLTLDWRFAVIWNRNCKITEVVFVSLARTHTVEVLLVVKEKLVHGAQHLITSLPTIPLDPRLVRVRHVAAALTALGAIGKAGRGALLTRQEMTRAK